MVDFKKYSAALDSVNLIYDEKGENSTRLMQLRPVKQDDGSNPLNQRPEYGDITGQGEFSGGSGQTFFHRSFADDRMYLYSRGIDITAKKGGVSLVPRLNALSGVTASYSMAIVGSTLFIDTTANNLLTTTTNLSTTATEDFRAGEAGDVAIRGGHCLASTGDELFACLASTGGIHKRNTAGTWSHYNDLEAQNIYYLKNRLVLAGYGSPGKIYELATTGAATTAPTAIDTLPANANFRACFEYGPYVYAIVQLANNTFYLYHYGLNAAGTALEPKGSTPAPSAVKFMAGIGYAGFAYLLGERQTNSSTGADMVFYRASANSDGTLNFELEAEAPDTTAADVTFTIDSIAAHGNFLVFPWRVQSDTGYGVFQGLARYDVARRAFAPWVSYDSELGSNKVAPRQVTRFLGSWVATHANGIHYTDLTNKRPNTAVGGAACIWLSGFDWGNGGQKLWDQISVSCPPLPAGASLQVEYATAHPETSPTWTSAGTLSTTNSTGTTFTLTSVVAQTLWVRVTLNRATATTTGAELTTISVRSYPKPATNEWVVTRTVRIAGPKDRKDKDAPWVTNQNPETIRESIHDKAYTSVTLTERGATYTGRLESIEDVTPAQPVYETSLGDAVRDFSLLKLTIIGTRS